MTDLISVIIPVYNRQDMVGECIASLQAQSYPHLEIILIDDGSTDNTLEVCQKLAAEDSRIVLLDGGHGGVSAARNKGLDAATGKYVFFLDSDDVIHPMLLEELSRDMSETGAPMGGTHVHPVAAKYWPKLMERMPKAGDFSGTEHYSHEETVHRVFHSQTPLNMIGGVMISREWVGQTRFREDLFIGEDFYFIYQNLIKGADAVFLKESRYYNRIHDSNTSWDFGYTGFWTRFCRRELVWKSEESMGRAEYANRQKQEGFGCYLRCLKHNKPHCEDVKRMCQTIWSYRQELLPALSWKGKIRYYLSVFTPGIYLMIFRKNNANNT